MKIVSAIYTDFAHWDVVFPDAELITAGQVGSVVFQPDDILILHGGVDINPAIYGEDPHRYTQHPNLQRDAIESGLYHDAVKAGARIFGICRGAQLITALNGGKLKQHIEGHTGGGHSILHRNGTVIKTNSCHHQMMLPPSEDNVLGRAPDGTTELVYYPETRSYGVQGHPEWLSFRHELVQHVIDEALALWG